MRTLMSKLFAAAALSMLWAPYAHAAPVCRVHRVVSVDFGAYNVFSPTPLRAAGNITYRCDGNRDYVLQIHLSEGSGQSFAPRRMQSGTASLAYNLFLDAGATVVWGDGQGGTGRYGPVQTANHTAVDVPIYGLMPPGQSAAAGTYSDQIVITMVF